MALLAVMAAALLGFCGYAVVAGGTGDPASDRPASDDPAADESESTPTTEDPFDAVIRFCNAQNERESDVARCQRGFRNEDGSYNSPW